VPSLAKATVLVVEDDPTLRNVYRAMLTDAVLTVITVEDGRDALRLIDAGHLPDVILLDLVLPRMSGRDVQRQLMSHPHTRRIPIVIVTGTDADDLTPGDFRYILKKPVDADELIGAVRKCVTQAHLSPRQ
jgi:CheY-like chemotaxis protein